MSNHSSAEKRPLVWIVDDSPTEAMFAERSLGPTFEFERFADGAAVVERLAAGALQPDLVLLDWVMPGMPGDEVCRFLRTHPRTTQLPIILITASRTETSDVAQGLASGATDYVARPFAIEELRARVDSAIRAKQLSDSAQQEHLRLSTINRLGRALFEAGTDVDQILAELANILTVSLCDGCSILLLPGSITVGAVTRHRADRSGEALAAIASLADPIVHAFSSSREARTTLPPTYTPYIDRFGLRGLAILPFGSREVLRGVVTLTRDGQADPFDADDIATIETCIEYASLAIESAARFDAERVGRAQRNAVLANLPIGVIVTDRVGALDLVNAAARELLPGAELARDLGGIFRIATWSASDGALISEADWLVLLAQPKHTETMIQSPGATPIFAAVSGVTLRDGRGQAVGMVTMIQDVTAAHAINLERERTGQFQQQMLGIVGHDLRTPLGAILIGTELLDMKHDPASASIVKRIESSANRMTRMVDQLLDVTHARLGGGIPVAPRQVQLLPLIKSVMDELSLANTKSRLELVASSDVIGKWDPDRLGQVVSNVVSNAVQYGLLGAPIVVTVEGGERTATISIHNQIRGKPIPASALTTLFDPYRRGATGGHNSSGLGLGLYIVHEIVLAHGGTMSVESVESGTTFRVVLPKAGPKETTFAR